MKSQGRIKRIEKPRLAGFGVKDVADLQAAMLDGEIASDLIRGDRLVGIRVRYPAEYRTSTDKLKSHLLTSPAGQTVPMSSISSGEIDEDTTEIRRENLRNMSAVTVRLEKRDLGSAMQEIQRRLPKEIALPPGTHIE
jgi:Cu/Ag efflux pump CusA